MIRNSTLLILLFFSWQWVSTPRLQADDTSAEAKTVLLRMRQHLVLIDSVSYSYERSTVRSPPGKVARATNTVGEFGYNKGRFWDHYDNNYEPAKIAFVRKAFEGKFYQRSEPAQRELIIWVNRQEQPINRQPLLQSFEFLIHGQRYDFEVFTDEANWLELAKSAKLLEPQTVREYKCDVIQVDGPGASAPSILIYAARDLGSYPIRLVRTLKTGAAQDDVLEFKKVDLAGGFVVIPTKYQAVGLDENGVVAATSKYTLKLHTLNEPLADAKFYISGPEKIRPVNIPADIPDDFAARRSTALAKEAGTEKPSQTSPAETKKDPPEKAEKGAGQAVPDKPPVPKLLHLPMKISGRALDMGGKPISGATVYLQAAGNGTGIDGLLAEAKTDRDGRYEFADLKIPVPMTRLDGQRSWTEFQVFAKAPGYAFAWQSMKRLIVDPRCREADGSLLPDFRNNGYLPGEKVELDLTFQRPRPVTGRIVDEKGKPIPGYEVTMTICDYLDKEGKEPRYDFRGLGVYAGSEVYKIMPDQLTAKTDAGGRFEFKFTPPEIWGMMWLDHPEFSTKILKTTTSDREIEPDGLPLHKSPIELTIPRPRRVTLQVQHSDTGTSAPGVFVSAGSTERSHVSSSGESDDKGQVMLRLPPGKYRMHGFSKVATRYLPFGDRDLVVADGPDEQTATLSLDPGCVVTFKIVEAKSGRPIPGLTFWSAADKEAALARRREQLTPQPNVSERASVTNKEGKCTVIVNPGKLRFGYPEKEIPDGYAADSADDHTIGREVVLPAGKDIEVEFKLRELGGKE